MHEPGEQILIVEVRKGQASRLQQALASFGYSLYRTADLAPALELLSQGKVSLVLVTAGGYGSFASLPSGNDSVGGWVQESATSGAGVYELCRQLKFQSTTTPVPLLLVVPALDPAALPRGLEAGADYLLFAPCHKADMLRSVRHALLNGAALESASVFPAIEVIHQDRMCTVTAGRGRLARLLFAVYDDLLHYRSAWSWAEAEARELRHRLQSGGQPATVAAERPDIIQGIAHDLNNLLEAMRTSVVGLNLDPASSRSYQAALEAALAQAEALVATLQDFAEQEDADWPAEAVEPAVVIASVVEASLLAQRAPNVRLVVRTSNLPPIQCNRILLSRCLHNLIWNAVQAMPSGGILSIVGRVEGDRVLLEARDTGIGIAKQDREKIFMPRFTTKSGHRGLGLSVVRDLVQRAGGEITVTSRPGGGSRFVLRFPIAHLQQLQEQRGQRAKHSSAPVR
ncbi:MAG: hybrid sensor histidine kinase/response regulator [Acidobacteria bacterium]|nr:hybrid sensor histidine kinase/response regulator [Acidobacteriota bacterium]